MATVSALQKSRNSRNRLKIPESRFDRTVLAGVDPRLKQIALDRKAILMGYIFRLSKPGKFRTKGAVLSGLEIAMACDILIARKEAGKIGLPEVNLGVLPGTGGTQRLSRIVGKSRAIEMMVSGQTFSFEKAQEIGLVNEVWDGKPEEWWERVLLYAKQFCPPNKASKAVGNIKRAVCSGAEVPFESALAIERELQQLLFQSQDAKEGISAYVEKRVPAFKGK